MNVDLILYYLEPLLQVQTSGSLKLLSWLLFQWLRPLSPEQAKALGLPTNEATWQDLQQKMDTQAAGIRTCVDNAADDEARRKCVEPLLTLVEAYLPALFVPADWQVAWMGVEG